MQVTLSARRDATNATASHAANSAAWSAGHLPDLISSKVGVSTLFLVLAIVLACADNFADPDLWRHILLGNTILHTGHIILKDASSYTAAGLSARNHEWLAEVILALSYGWFGVIGLKLVKLLCAAAAIAALAVGLRQTAASSRMQRTILVLSAGALTSQMQFRPQLFTFAMLSVVMAVMAIEIYRGSARLWPLVPMFALWANLHAGFVVGLGALAVAAIVVTLQELYGDRLPKRGLRLGCIAAIAACATLSNPFGVGMWYSFLHSVSDPLIRQMVNEWVPLPTILLQFWQTSRVSLSQELLPLALFAAFFYSIAIERSLDDAALTLIAILFIGAAFDVSRNVALAVIAIAIPLAHHLALGLSRRVDLDATSNPAQDEISRSLLACIIVCVAIFGGMFSTNLSTWKPVPANAVNFMKEKNLSGNILNQFEWGSYLIWRLPKSRVFIDGRAELLYPDSILRAYAEFYYGLSGATAAIDNFPNDFILIKPGTGDYRTVIADHGWKMIYHDEVSALFAKASTPIAEDRAGVVTHRVSDRSFP